MENLPLLPRHLISDLPGPFAFLVVLEGNLIKRLPGNFMLQRDFQITMDRVVPDLGAKMPRPFWQHVPNTCLAFRRLQQVSNCQAFAINML